MRLQISTVIYTNVSDRVVWVCESHDAAIAAVAGECEDNWEHHEIEDAMPADPLERIVLYFEQIDQESAEIADHTIEVDHPLEALVREALAHQAQAFEDGKEISGADLVDFFARWRPRAKLLITA